MRAFVESTLSDLSHEVSEMSEAKKKKKNLSSSHDVRENL